MIQKPKKKAVKKTTTPKEKMPKNVRQRALSEFQKLRKNQEAVDGYCYCISCGRRIQNGTMECQGGHLISRQDNATCLEHDNVQPQCSICNVRKGGNVIAYEYNLRNKIGDERVDRLINMSMARQGDAFALAKLTQEDREKALKKWTNKDWYEAYKKYKEKNKQYEE